MVLASVLVAGGAMACSSVAKTTLRSAAAGSWDCRAPSGSGSPILRVTVKSSGRFLLLWDFSQVPGGTPGGVTPPTVAGTWKLAGQRVVIAIDTPKTASGTRLQVDGAALDGTRLTIGAPGYSSGDVGTVDHVVVKRKGFDQVMFRSTQPGSQTYTCRKQ